MLEKRIQDYESKLDTNVNIYLAQEITTNYEALKIEAALGNLPTVLCVEMVAGGNLTSPLHPEHSSQLSKFAEPLK